MSKPMLMMLIVLLVGSAPSGAEAGALDIGDVRDSWRIEYLLAKAGKEMPTIPSFEDESVAEPAPGPVEVSSVRNSKGHMLNLTSDNFATTVMKDTSPVEHWVIKFCIDSWQCRKLGEIFKEVSVKWQKSLNFNPAANLPDRFANTVRFAEVDCSTERQLCIEQGIESLPSVVHFHRKDLSRGSSKISAVHMWSDEVQSFAQWLERKLKGKVEQSAEPISSTASVKLSEAEPSSTKPQNAWEQATAEISVMMQDFDDFLDKQEVPRHAAYTCLLAISLALFASLWRLGWWQESPEIVAPEVRAPASAPELRRDYVQSHAAVQHPGQQELRRMPRPEASQRTEAPFVSGSMEL